MPVIRSMQQHDLPAVMRIQLACYQPEYHEPLAVLQQRFDLAARTAWVGLAQQQVAGYLVAYPSMQGLVTELNAIFKRYEQPNILYLHDLAVDRRFAGQSIAGDLLSAAFDHAQQQGWIGLALVAVQNSVGFWQKQGFQQQSLDLPQQQAYLAGYGDRAVYMQYRF